MICKSCLDKLLAIGLCVTLVAVVHIVREKVLGNRPAKLLLPSLNLRDGFHRAFAGSEKKPMPADVTMRHLPQPRGKAVIADVPEREERILGLDIQRSDSAL